MAQHVEWNAVPVESGLDGIPHDFRDGHFEIEAVAVSQFLQLPPPQVASSACQLSMSQYGGNDAREEVAQEVVLRQYDSRRLERKEEYRRRHKHPLEMCGPGNREESWAAIGRINAVITPCGTAGCNTLCAYPCVLRAARGRDEVLPTDGCAVCSASAWHQRTRHASTQRRWAEELRAGAKQLAARPCFVEQADAWRITGAALESVVVAALAQADASMGGHGDRGPRSRHGWRAGSRSAALKAAAEATARAAAEAVA